MMCKFVKTKIIRLEQQSLYDGGGKYGMKMSCMCSIERNFTTW